MPSLIKVCSSNSSLLNRESEGNSDPLLPSSEPSSSSVGSDTRPVEVRSSPLDELPDDILSIDFYCCFMSLFLERLDWSSLDGSSNPDDYVLVDKGKELSELREDEGSELPDSREECFIGLLYT